MSNKILLVGWLILFIGFSQANWTQQHSGSITLNDIDFPPRNINYGFACGNSSLVLMTFDGGNRWRPIRTPTSGNFNAICFPVDTLFGYIACDSGNVLTSRDGGINWDKINVGTQSDLYGIHFPNDNVTGYVVGREGAIWQTTDQGRTWNDVSIPDPINLYDVYFVNEYEGWVVGDNGTILRTSSGGREWETQSSNTTAQLLGVHFVDGGIGWVVGANRTCLKTNDGGQNWQPIDIPVAPVTVFNSVIFPVDENTGFVCGSYGVVAKTEDGGNSWTITNLLYNLNAVEFPLDNSVGWVCGDQEAIFKYAISSIEETNLGQELDEKILCSSPNPFRRQTTIRILSLANSQSLSAIRIYDINGNLVKSFSLTQRSPTTSHRLIWDGSDEFNQRVSPGVYFLEYKTNLETRRLKLTVLE